MVSIDAGRVLTQQRVHLPRILGFVSASAAAAILVTVASLMARGMTPEGWAFAALNLFRLSFFVFLVPYAAGALSRLAPGAATAALARDRGLYLLAFALVYVLSLALQAAPLTSAVSLPDAAYLAVCGAALLLALMPWRRVAGLGLQGLWLAFALSALEHMVGPHRPDPFPPVFLLLLVAVALVRFADDFAVHTNLRRLSR